jgi:long-chain acyl-CoA synthetase
MDLMEEISGWLRELGSGGERPAMIAFQGAGNQVWSFERLGRSVERAAAGFAKAGFGAGCRAVVFARGSPEWAVVALGLVAAGGAVVPVDAQSADRSLQRILEDCAPRWVFTTVHEGARIRALRPELAVFYLDAPPGDAQSWETFLAEAGAGWPGAEVRPEDCAVLFYTSGTSGSEKGVPLSHRNLAVQLRAVRAAGFVRETDRVLLPLPLHHVYPFVIGLLAPLALWIPVVFPEALTGPQVLRAIREGQVSVVIGVPRLYTALISGVEAGVARGGAWAMPLFRLGLWLSAGVNRFTGVRLGRWIFWPVHRAIGEKLRVLASGGAALAPECLCTLEALGWRVVVGYGLTETSPLLTLAPPGQAHGGSVGRALPGVELRIVDPETGVETGGVGEVHARGGAVFSGYWNLPEKTAQALDLGGWFHTGDLGFFDARGELHLTGRISSLIVTEGGEKIQPEDLEAVYAECPGIREIGVLQWDGKLVGVIVPGMDAEGAGIEIRGALQSIYRRLPTYQRLSRVMMTREPLERTALGKIRRHRLLARCAQWMEKVEERSPEAFTEADFALLNEPVARRAWEYFGARYPKKQLTLGMSLGADLGVDSMEWLELTLEFRQRLETDLGESAIARIETLRDLLRELVSAGRAVSTASWWEDPEGVLSEEQRRWLNPQGPLLRGTARILYELERFVVRKRFRLRVEGEGNLPESEAVVFVPNHLSYLDPPVLAAALGYRRMRETYWGGWTGVMTTHWWNRALSRLAQVVPIDPDHALISSVAFGAAALKLRKNLVWFPEGGVSRSGQLDAFKPGVGLLLEHSQMLAVPVAIAGTERALPPGRWWPRREEVRVKFGAPVGRDELELRGKGRTVSERITDGLRQRVSELQKDSDGPGEVRNL